ncbi:hypothetical protein D3C74_264340 [compost metagenome]
MIFAYIIGSFITVTISAWLFGLIGVNIGEGPDAGAWFFYGSVIIGILLSIHDKLDEDKAGGKKFRFSKRDKRND